MRFDYLLSHDGDTWLRLDVPAPDWETGALRAASEACGHEHEAPAAAPCAYGLRVAAWRVSAGRPETITAGAVLEAVAS